MSVTGTPISPASTSKLDAVNEILEASGQFPVTALDTDGTTAQALAEVMLDRSSRRIQEHGWFENTELAVDYAQVAGDIAMTGDELRVDGAQATGWQRYKYSIRNGSLYDLDNKTATFTADVQLDVVRELAFANCSGPLKRYITADAKLLFHRRQVGDPKQIRELEKELTDAMREAARADADNADLNILETDESYRILGVSGILPEGR